MNSNLLKISFAALVYCFLPGKIAAASKGRHLPGNAKQAFLDPDQGMRDDQQRSTLPLTLISFTAEKTASGKIELVWKTAQEVYTSHYNIERSTDGRKWTRIGSRNAKGGQQGTVETYVFTDASPSPETNYYRLQVVDDDNSSDYSSVRLVNMKSDQPVRIYPTLARTQSTLYVEGISPEKAQVELISNEGKPAYRTRLYSNTFILPALLPGIYHVRITDISRPAVVNQQKMVVY